ncbi:unnamed protein product [Adineta steineri]|uniref:Uncharacterized protein n=1 Tax=Adineta steineri TaxID=433720 RepID=A0A814KWZ2_9BILA|nr:unnamed protein product [Adineta steineri]CAF3667151.1 unnamed protein product [Adineta steineri]
MYKNTFTLIYLTEQHEIARIRKSLSVVYKWPESFPDCTPTLRRWSLKTRNDSDDYLIFDDIDWDRFNELCFPLRKDLLKQNGLTITSDKHESTTEINVKQPAIVLLNLGRAEGALGCQSITYEEQCEATYWQRQAIIYRMSENNQ